MRNSLGFRADFCCLMFPVCCLLCRLWFVVCCSPVDSMADPDCAIYDTKWWDKQRILQTYNRNENFPVYRINNHNTL